MPVESILYVTFVVAVLTQFAVVLAYAEWATRHANDHVPAREKEKPLNQAEPAVLRHAA